MRGLDSESLNRIRDAGNWVVIRLARRASQNSINEQLCRTKADQGHEIHGLIHSGRSWNTRQETQLVQAQAQSETDRQIESPGIALGIVSDQTVKPQLPAQHTHHDFVTERTVVCLQFLCSGSQQD